MSYTSCVRIHSQGCEFYVEGMLCPERCKGYTWDNVTKQESVWIKEVKAPIDPVRVKA